MSKEAMTLALEALQVSVSCTDMYYVPLGKSMIPEVEEAIKSLEEALSKQEQGEPDKYVMDIECTKCGAKQSGILTVNTTPQQPVIDKSAAIRIATALGWTPPQQRKQEQGEPVAVKHMMEWADYLKRKSDYGQHMQIPSEMSAGACWELAVELEQFINTTPQPAQKPWVGLTDEEIDYYIVHRCGTATKKNLVELIRLCEIKLKEKNT